MLFGVRVAASATNGKPFQAMMLFGVKVVACAAGAATTSGKVLIWTGGASVVLGYDNRRPYLYASVAKLGRNWLFLRTECGSSGAYVAGSGVVGMVPSHNSSSWLDFQ